MRRIAVLAVACVCCAGAAVAQDAPSARQLLAEAGRAVAQGQHEQAQKAYQAALGIATSDDERAQALFGLANVCRRRGEVEGQIGYYRQAEALTKANLGYVQAARRQLAMLCREHGDLDTARAMLGKLLAEARSPDERLALTLELAQLDLQQARPAEAVKRLEPFLKDAAERPNARELYSTLIMALIAAERTNDALALARDGLKRFPDRPDIVTAAAAALAERGKLEAAMGLVQEALLAQPEQDELLRGLFDLYQRRDQLARLTDWLDTRAEGPGQALWLRHLARVYEWTDDPQQALGVYARLVALQPQDGTLLQTAAQMALRANDPARAVEWLQQARTLQPQDQSLVILLGEALLKQGKLQPALQLWREGLGYAPADAGSVRQLGSVLLRHELYEAALETYREGRQATGQREVFALNMAAAHEKLGQTAEAVREYTLALTARERGQSAGTAASHLYALADDEAARPDVTAALEAARQQGQLPVAGLGVLLFARVVQGEDARRTLDELMPAGAPEEAKHDRIGVLLRTANELEMREQPELALPLYERLQRDAGVDFGAQMPRRVADLQLRSGDWQGALVTLRGALEGERGAGLPARQRAELALKLGDILLRQARRPADAIGAYEMAVKAAPDGNHGRLAQWGQADALFALGKHGPAIGEYARLLNLPRPEHSWDMDTVPGLAGTPPVTPPEEDYVAFQRAEALFRQGEYGKAGPAFHKLAADFPQSLYANDALERVLLIGRLQQDKAGAEAYRQALQAWARGEAEAALQVLTDLNGGPDDIRPLQHPTADAGLMMQAEIRVWQGEVGEAVAAYDRLRAACPASPLGPRAAFTAAMLLSKTDRPAAQARLRALVGTYPEAPEAEEAAVVLQAWSKQ